MKNKSEVKVLLFDIETKPILAWVWGLFDQNIGLEQIHEDWNVLSWSAKWLDAPNSEIMYEDLRHSKTKRDDKKILTKLWKLLDEADIAITQNGVAFDNKKLNARFALLGFKPPTSYKNEDTLMMAKKNFGFTSNKLEYLSNANPNRKHTKLKSKKFPGFLLWKECLANNQEAWKEMEKYNKHDVLALEELYKWLRPWSAGVDFNVYREGKEHVCKCGSKSFQRRGITRLASGWYQRYVCKSCGHESRGQENLMPKDKKKSLRRGVNR